MMTLGKNKNFITKKKGQSANHEERKKNYSESGHSVIPVFN